MIETEEYYNLKKHTLLKSYFEDKTGLKAEKVKDLLELKRPKKKKPLNESFNESFVFLHIADYSYHQLDNLIELYFSEVWGKKERFEVETEDPNHLGVVFMNKDRKGIGYSVIVSRYTNINIEHNTYSLSIEFFTNKHSLETGVKMLKATYQKE